MKLVYPCISFTITQIQVKSYDQFQFSLFFSNPVLLIMFPVLSMKNSIKLSLLHSLIGNDL